MPDWSRSFVVIGVVAFATSAVATRLWIAIAPRLGLVDHPSDGKYHRAPTPVGGGVAILAGLLPLLLLPELAAGESALILAGSLFLGAVGLIDDRWRVSAVVKLGLLIALTVLAWSYDIGATTTRIPALDLGITILWMVGVSSAFNAIDNMDGLATGVAAIAAAGFLVIALQTGQWALGALSVGLLGATLGFLPFNYQPARVFMGDTGSFALGFLLACLGVVGDWHSNEVIAAIIPILLLGVPIFDLAFTVLRRAQLGITRGLVQCLAHCDTDHLSHRLVRLGLSTRSAVTILWLVAASFSLSALTLQYGRSAEGLIHLLQGLLIVAAFVPVLCLADRGREASPDPSAPPARAHRWLLGVLLLSGALAALSR